MKVIIGDRMTGKTTRLLKMMVDDSAASAGEYDAHVFVSPSEAASQIVQKLLDRSARAAGTFAFCNPAQASRHRGRYAFYVDDWHLVAGSPYLDRLQGDVIAMTLYVPSPHVTVLQPRAVEQASAVVLP